MTALLEAPERLESFVKSSPVGFLTQMIEVLELAGHRQGADALRLALASTLASVK